MGVQYSRNDSAGVVILRRAAADKGADTAADDKGADRVAHWLTFLLAVGFPVGLADDGGAVHRVRRLVRQKASRRRRGHGRRAVDVHDGRSRALVPHRVPRRLHRVRRQRQRRAPRCRHRHGRQAVGILDGCIYGALVPDRVPRRPHRVRRLVRQEAPRRRRCRGGV